MDQERDWAKDAASGIGKRIAFYRERQRLSAQQLAERCADLGMPSISRVVITKLENGRREAVSTAELQVLAAALGVPAIVLLTGLSTAETVEILPGAAVEPYDAVMWLTGETSEPGRGAAPESSPMALYGLHRHLLSVWHEERARAEELRASREDAEELFDVMLADGNAQHLRTIRATMRQLGYVVPKLPADIARALGEEVPDGAR